MITIIRSANLTVLKSWLIGGQVTNMGNWSEGFHCLQREEAGRPTSRETTEEMIEDLIDEYGDEPSNGPNGSYQYWGDLYKFKRPSAKKMEILVDQIWAKIQEWQKEEINH